MLIVTMLSVILLSLIVLCVIMPNAIMLSAILLSVIMPNTIMLSDVAPKCGLSLFKVKSCLKFDGKSV